MFRTMLSTVRRITVVGWALLRTYGFEAPPGRSAPLRRPHSGSPSPELFAQVVLPMCLSLSRMIWGRGRGEGQLEQRKAITVMTSIAVILSHSIGLLRNFGSTPICRAIEIATASTSARTSSLAKRITCHPIDSMYACRLRSISY
jgi:hypothetical protein